MALAIRVIPCLDVAEGRVVKGVNFTNLRDAGDAVALAAKYYQDGADELTFLDVNATQENRATLLELVTKTAEQIHIPLTVGGGIRDVDDVARLLAAGADKVSIGSAAVATPDLLSAVAERFGAQVVVLSIDIKRAPTAASGFTLTTHGGRQQTNVDAIEFMRQSIQRGVGEILVNSIDADGTRSGFDLELLEIVDSISDVPFIASGGAGSAKDFVGAAATGASAILAASIFHEGAVSISDAKRELQLAGFEVR